MKIATINGSPKLRNSSNGELLEKLRTCFTNDAATAAFCFNKPAVYDSTLLELLDYDV